MNKKSVWFVLALIACGVIIWGCQCVSEQPTEPQPTAAEVVEERQVEAEPEAKAEPQPEEKPAPQPETRPEVKVTPKPALPQPAPRVSKIVPRTYYGRVATRLGDSLPKYHVLQQQLNDEISQRAWTNLVTFYDFDHSVFLQSDLDRLAAHEKTLDDEIESGDVSFGYDVYNLYVTRLHERVDFATNLLATVKTWDFSTNETYRARRKDAPWPETKADAEEHWRKRIKNEMLVRTVNHALDKSTNTVDFAAEIVKSYRQYVTVLTEPDEEAVLQHYLSALSRAYDPHSDYMSPASKEDFVF